MSTSLRQSVLCLSAILALLPAAGPAGAQVPLPPDVVASIDRTVEDVLARTGAPSASVAVVQDGRLAFAKAYGHARIEPTLPATPAMRYSIGSVSKQFTAAAVLLLVQDGRLSLDDRVSRWFPQLTRAGDVTVRHLLSMTSGYSDYWPQDYVMPPMLADVTAADIMRDWAMRPLDFEPGTRWQYSNTNYVIAGAIVERVAGVPLLTLLKSRVFDRLQMATVSDTDQAPLGSGEPMRYRQYALGPARPAPKEGKGWMFAAGELAMTASDLARWDVALIDRAILTPASHRTLETEVLLENGAPTGYGLGVNIGFVGGRRRVSHTGEVSGFTASNEVFPDERVAVVALVNVDASPASSQITSRLATLVFGARTADDTRRAVEQARSLYDGLQQGRIDRSRLTDNCRAYFTDEALRDFAASLGPLGPPDVFTQAGQSLRGGLVARSFTIGYTGKRTLRVTAFMTPDGRFEQYQIAAID